MKRILFLVLVLAMVAGSAWAFVGIQRGMMLEDAMCIGCSPAIWINSPRALAPTEGTYWAEPRTALWDATRTDLWNTPRNTEVPE